MNGIFISFEGPEGSGKSTHAKMVIEKLKKLGYEVIAVRDPGGTPVGEAIRNILQHESTDNDIHPETETLLFSACRAQLVSSVIKPAIATGKCVVADRFVDSTTAYQGYGRGFNLDEINSINNFAVRGTMPDITIMLDLPVEEGFNRVMQRNTQAGKNLDRMERAGLDFHQRVYNGYKKLTEQYPERFKVIQSNRPQEDVANDIWQAVEAVLKAKEND